MKRLINWKFLPMPRVRLNKFIADTGYCARRKADVLITQGRVAVNGHPVTTLGAKIDPDQDTVTVDGQPLGLPKERFYLAFHKPAGVLTARSGRAGQTTLYNLLPPEYQAGDPVGRLDKDSSGLLILSNDGDFVHRLMHPRHHWPKVYDVQLDRPLQAPDIRRLQDGLWLEPEHKLARMTALQALHPERKDGAWIQVTLITGYNRQIRRMLALLNYRVRALQRVAFGPIRLGHLPAGHIRPLTEPERAALLAGPPGTTPPDERQHRPQNQHGKPQQHA